jgi:hypothetical protein
MRHYGPLKAGKIPFAARETRLACAFDIVPAL